MIMGYNHNLMYKGEIFHVQTEDSGEANPHFVTVLYRGGAIISSKKTSYSDILKIENLPAIIEDLMKEQHKGMMRRLKSGEFDEKISVVKAPMTSDKHAIQTPEASPDEAAFPSPGNREK